MKAKRFLSIIMAIVMVFAMCSCASADSGESDKKESVAASEEVEKVQEDSSKEEAAETPKVTEEPAAEESAQTEVADDEENELGLTGSEMEEIYAAIEEDLQKEYLDVNNINVEDFSIPDDDESWEYFLKCCNEIIIIRDFDISKEELQNTISQMVSLPEENQEIMTIISYSFSNSLKEFEKDFLITMFSIDDSSLELSKELITSNVFAASKTEK